MSDLESNEQQTESTMNAIAEQVETAVATVEESTAMAQGVQPMAAAPAGVSPLVSMLASGVHDPATIRELLEIQREHKKDLAREAYALAMAEFRKRAPKITKDQRVFFKSQKGVTDYRHASLAHVLDEANPILGELGLNLSWHPRVESGTVIVETRLTHEQGHAESIELPGPMDNSGNKNSIQAMSSTITYLKRTGGMALLGLAESHDDDDQFAEPPAKPVAMLDHKQQSTLVDLLASIEELSEGYTARWRTHYSSKWSANDSPLGLDIPADQFDTLRGEIETGIEKRKKAAESAS